MKNKCTYILVGLMLFLTGCEDFLDSVKMQADLMKLLFMPVMSLYVAFWIKYTVNWTLITVW